jgi:hypothetical protein
LGGGSAGILISLAMSAPVHAVHLTVPVAHVSPRRPGRPDGLASGRILQVSAFVAVTVLLFSYLRYRTGDRIIAFLKNHKRMQPIAGALLGLTPGW